MHMPALEIDHENKQYVIELRRTPHKDDIPVEPDAAPDAAPAGTNHCEARHGTDASICGWAGRVCGWIECRQLHENYRCTARNGDARPGVTGFCWRTVEDWREQGHALQP